MKKYLSAFVCGFGAGVLHVVPVAKTFSCCLIIPLAAFISLMLDRKANPTDELIPSKKALMFGLMTGLYAALFGSGFDILITLITKNNDVVAAFSELPKVLQLFSLPEDIKNDVMKLFSGVRDDILQYGFSPLYAFSILINNLVINSVFGIIGGIIGAQVINSKQKNQS